MLDTHGRKYVDPLIKKTAQTLLKAKLTADQVTVSAFIIGILCSAFIYIGEPIYAVFTLWVSGFLDAVDGAMARLTKTSSFGTVLDVTFDRIVEISVIVSLALIYQNATFQLLLLNVAILFSMTVFLTVGAVTERKGNKSFYYQAGVAERTEGFILFSLMILLPTYLKELTLFFAGIVVFTALQRLIEAKKIMKE